MVRRIARKPHTTVLKLTRTDGYFDHTINCKWEYKVKILSIKDVSEILTVNSNAKVLVENIE